jgi:hypothetical protein
MTSPELVSILLFLNGSIFLGSGNTRRALASFGWLDRLLKSSRVPACGQDDRTTHSVCTCTCSHSQSLQTRGSRCSRQRCLASHTTGVGGSRCGNPAPTRSGQKPSANLPSRRWWRSRQSRRVFCMHSTATWRADGPSAIYGRERFPL